MIVERLLKVALFGSTWVLYLLLALSIVSIAVAVDRLWFFRRHTDDPERLRFALHRALSASDWGTAASVLEKSPSIEALIVGRALLWRHGGANVVQSVLDSEVQRERERLEKGLSLLGTLGNNAPFVGLFGTVLGVIEAFHHLGAAGQNQGAMGNVMAGIAEALVATGVGLFVAIPAVVAYNIAQKRIADIEGRALSLGKLVIAAVEMRGGAPDSTPTIEVRELDDDAFLATLGEV